MYKMEMETAWKTSDEKPEVLVERLKGTCTEMQREKKATELQRYQSIESEHEKWENHECRMVRELDEVRKEKEKLIDCHPFSSMMS